MHSKAPYEEIISGKLAALTLPDMADAIWARIEHQLDIDLPADDGDVPEPSPSSGGGLPVLAGSSIFLFIGALVSYFYFQPSSKPNSIPQNTSAQSTGQQEISSSKASSSNAKSPQRNTTFYPVRDKPVIDKPLSPKNTFINEHDEVAIVPAMDTSTATTPTTEKPSILMPEVKKDSSIRKPRGVQGISNNDYRIIPKKDST